MAEQVIHSLASALNTKINDMLGTHFQVKSQFNGQFPSLIQTEQMWIIFAQRATTNAGGCWLVNRWTDGTPQITEISITGDMHIITNNQGTVEITYSNSSNNILACAIQLY